MDSSRDLNNEEQEELENIKPESNSSINLTNILCSEEQQEQQEEINEESLVLKNNEQSEGKLSFSDDKYEFEEDMNEQDESQQIQDELESIEENQEAEKIISGLSSRSDAKSAQQSSYGRESISEKKPTVESSHQSAALARQSASETRQSIQDVESRSAKVRSKSSSRSNTKSLTHISTERLLQQPVVEKHRKLEESQRIEDHAEEQEEINSEFMDKMTNENGDNAIEETSLFTIFPSLDDMNVNAMPDETANIMAMREYLDAKAEEYEMRGRMASETANTESIMPDNEESILEVLHPSHELMKPFQARLKAHLSTRLSKIMVEKRVAAETLKKRREEREAIGSQLYNVQQELAKYQNALHKYRSENSEMENRRIELEKTVDGLRVAQKERLELLNCEKRNATSLQQEMENLSQRLHYLEQAKDSMKADIAIVKRAAHKTEEEVTKAEESKKAQDLFVERLTDGIAKLSDEMKTLEVQLAAQVHETTQTKQAISQAVMEIESINMDKTNLLQQWNNSLIGVKKRDEAYSTIMLALNNEKEKMLKMEKEMDGVRRSIVREQEENEKLTSVLRRIDNDINNMKKQINSTQQIYDSIQSEFSQLMKILQETEDSLNQANQEKTQLTGRLNEIRKEVEMAYQAKQKLDDVIMQQLQQQLTHDKSSKYTSKLTDKIRQTTRNLENEISKNENEISSSLLDATQLNGRVGALEKQLAALVFEANEKNAMMNKSEADAQRRVLLIERKQVQLEHAKRKLEQLIHDAGGEEIGPMEMRIRSLQRVIAEEVDAINELQDAWLHGQAELVKLSKDREQQSQNIEALRKQLIIAAQKKIRTEGELERERGEIADLERKMNDLHTDTSKLGRLLYSEKQTEQNLAKDNLLAENTFIATLKDAERESIEMEEKLEKLNVEKERLLNSLVEAERQIMLWEKKTELARETKTTIDQDIGQGEIQEMKLEIHRMQVRLAELKKQQSKMLADMEKTINKREVILDKTEIANKNKPKEKGTLKKEINSMKMKIKQTNQEIDAMQREIDRITGTIDHLNSDMKEKRIQMNHTSDSLVDINTEIETLERRRNLRLIDALGAQTQLKYYQQVKNDSYVRIHRNDATLDAEYSRQVERMHNMVAIVDMLHKQFPQAVEELQRVTQVFGTLPQQIFSKKNPHCIV